MALGSALCCTSSTFKAFSGNLHMEDPYLPLEKDRRLWDLVNKWETGTSLFQYICWLLEGWEHFFLSSLVCLVFLLVGFVFLLFWRGVYFFFSFFFNGWSQNCSIRMHETFYSREQSIRSTRKNKQLYPVQMKAENGLCYQRSKSTKEYFD